MTEQAAAFGLTQAIKDFIFRMGKARLLQEEKSEEKCKAYITLLIFNIYMLGQ